MGCAVGAVCEICYSVEEMGMEDRLTRRGMQEEDWIEVQMEEKRKTGTSNQRKI